MSKLNPIICEDCGRHETVYKTIRNKVIVWLCWACFNQEEE